MRPIPPPLEPDHAVQRRLGLAWAAVAWERAWPLILPPLGLLGLFLALALFDVLPHLPGWLHGLILALGAGGLSFLVVRAILRWQLPGRDEAARRLERDSRLSHRPFAVLADRMAGGGDDPLAAALWQAHRRRMAALLVHLRVALPHPNMAARDPWGFRAAILLLLVIAAAGGWHDAGRRIGRALSPNIASTGLVPDSLEIWVTPPAYTGLAPIMLRSGQATGDPVVVPTGSAVLGVLAGGWGNASLLVDDAETRFERQGDGGQRVEATLRAGNLLAVRQAGRRIAVWPIQVAADALPSIAFALPPEAGERGRLRLVAAASDDYGLVKAWVEIRRLAPLDTEEPLVVELALPGNRPKAADLAGWHDLTAHPWAGLPVTLRPVAEDGAGQTGAGDMVAITLPERSFTHPVARALIEQRRLVTENRANALGVMGILDRIAVEPDLYNDDLVAFLAMRTARHALAERDFALAEIQDLLWNAALRIEDGDLSSAERGLEDARRALEKAIEENAPAERIEQLLTQFQAAMERYLDALADRMADNQQTPVPSERVLSGEDLGRMLETMRDLAQTGARDALKQMLGQLSQMLDGLQSGSPQQPNGPALEGLQQLRELAKRQQDMLDRSHRRAQERQTADGQKDAEDQQALRRALGEAAAKLAEGLGEAPQGLAEAGEAMGDAANALGQGDWPVAAEAQAEALRRIGQAARQAVEQMAQGQGGMMGIAPRDPLGRAQNGTGLSDDGTTRIPGGTDIQKAREILDELRRRSGEFSRPEPERDYLRRLLKQF